MRREEGVREKDKEKGRVERARSGWVDGGRGSSALLCSCDGLRDQGRN